METHNETERHKIPIGAGSRVGSNRPGHHHLVREWSEGKRQQQLLICPDSLQDHRACHLAGCLWRFHCGRSRDLYRESHHRQKLEGHRLRGQRTNYRWQKIGHGGHNFQYWRPRHHFKSDYPQWRCELWRGRFQPRDADAQPCHYQGQPSFAQLHEHL